MPVVSTLVTERSAPESAALFDRAWERPVRQDGPPPVARPRTAAGQRRRDGDRPLHRARRLYRMLAPWLAVAGALVWFVALRPVALGGPAGYVVVAGTSMEPLYRTGDLVITWRADSYRTGDVVAFGIPDSGATVIHRIVGGDAEAGYVLRGDNKPHDDLWRPTPDDVLGKAVVHVPHVGAVAALLRSQTALAAVAGVFAFMAVTAPTTARPARRRHRPMQPVWRGRHRVGRRRLAVTSTTAGGALSCLRRAEAGRLRGTPGDGRQREATVAEADPRSARTRRRRRAVGPAGAATQREPDAVVQDVAHEPPPPDDDERLLREVPPHHG